MDPDPTTAILTGPSSGPYPIRVSETVAIALITAVAGFGGALLGAAGAVFGPWWLARSERRAQQRRDQLEARRLAIAGWIDTQIALTNHLVPGDARTAELTAAANRATTELGSRLSSSERNVDTFIHGLMSYVAHPSISDVNMRRAYISQAGRLLIAWHRGDADNSYLEPFTMNNDYEFAGFSMW